MISTVNVQASLLSHAVFYCGWHLCEPDRLAHRDVRRLVLIACAQAQKPLVLKAFGIQDLSYSTFVSVSYHYHLRPKDAHFGQRIAS